MVLSLSSTAVVATAMAVTGSWSPPAGLAILAAVTVLGFVPVRAVVARAGVVVLGRTGPRRGDCRSLVDLDDTEDGWTDWYADARARSDEERRRRAAEAEAAEQDWRDWYAESRRPRLGNAACGRWDEPADPAERGTPDRGPTRADTVAPNPAELVTSKGTWD